MLSKFQILKAARLIKNEGVIAYPTESVFGLGCNPLSEQAVFRILQLKHRHVDKGLIIIAANLDQLKPYIDITENEEETINAEKHPMTWLVNKSELTPHWISGKHSKVAIRVSQHPVVSDLCNQLKQPIVSTSANPARLKPAETAMQARHYFSNHVDMYLNAKTGELNSPTPITDLQSGKQIRSG